MISPISDGNQKPEKKKNGGVRPGAGRKPSELTVQKRLFNERLAEEAEKSIDVIISIRDNPKNPKSLRLQAAVEIKNTAWGKPVQALRPVNANGEDAPFGIIFESALGEPSQNGKHPASESHSRL